MDSFPGEAPILVDSAGCGAVLKDYGHLVGTPEAALFAARVLDIHEWLASHSEELPAPVAGWKRPRVAVQDPCHLRHVQRVTVPVRTVLQHYADLVELPDEGRCCGAGGAYSALQPVLAGEIRAQKVAVIDSVSAELVASANPGCSMWLAGAGVRVRHPVEIVAEAAGLSGED
jgi:glycolate oxidase iron-sulfur subunit